MSETVSLHKLVKKAVHLKLLFKTFLGLFSQLNTKQVVQDGEYQTEILEIVQNPRNLNDKKITEYKVVLAIQLSLSSSEELKRFWGNLSKISLVGQVDYLIRLNKILKYEYSKYDKDIVRLLIKVQYCDYIVEVLDLFGDKKLLTEQKSLANHIVFFASSVIEHVVVKDEALVNDLVFQLATRLEGLRLSNLLDFLLLKSKNILSEDQIRLLIHSKATSTSSTDSSGSGEDKSLDLPTITTSLYKNLSVGSLSSAKQETYNETIKFLWLNKIMKLWKFADNESIFNNFVHNFIPSSDKNKNPYLTSFELIKATFKGFGYAVINNDDCYVLFNWKNFIITRIPVILSTLKFANVNDEETLERAVLNAFNSLPDSIVKVLTNLALGSTKVYDLRQIFIKSLIFNRLLPPVAFQKFFPMESKITQQVILSELAQYNHDLNLRRKFNDKLINVNSEFTSLEESGLLELCNSLPASLEYLYSRQIELSNAINDIIDEMKISREHEKLNRLLLSVMSNVQLTNILVFNSNPYVVLGKMIDYIDSENFRIDDDDENFQDVYSYCGVLILSIISIIEKFKIDLSTFNIKNSFALDYINNFYYRLCDDLTNQIPVNSDEEDNTIATNYNNLLIDWINALFDDSNDGLSDDLIKSISIKQIYKLIPLVYQQAITATSIGKIDFSILTNGIDYLSQVFLIPTTVSIINWLLLEISNKKTDAESLPVKVLSEIVKSNISSESGSQELSSLVFKIVVNICGSNILIALKKIKDWENSQRIRDVVSIVTANLDSNYVEKDLSLPESKLDININEQIKSHLVNFQQQADSPTPIHAFIHRFISDSKDQVLRVLLQEVTSYQKQNNEATKIFINLASYLVVSSSIDSVEDKKYWHGYLSNVSSSATEHKILKNSDKEFNSSMDYHYSSIFNDASSGASNGNSSSKVDIDDPILFLKEDDDDLMGEDDDLFNDKSSKQLSSGKLLEQLRTKVNRYNNLLAKFNVIFAENQDPSSPWHKTVNTLADKLLDDINDLYI